MAPFRQKLLLTKTVPEHQLDLTFSDHLLDQKMARIFLSSGLFDISAVPAYKNKSKLLNKMNHNDSILLYSIKCQIRL